MTNFWTDALRGRVTRLVGASPEALALALEPLPADAPATVTWTPSAHRTTSQLVAGVLDELENVACGLFPAWLPGAEGMDGAQGARAAAVRVLARRHASTTTHFGPYLARLAARAIGAATDGNGHPADHVRAAGLARIIADSFTRPYTALLVCVPGNLPVSTHQALLSACEWLAHHGGFAVWLTGQPVDVERTAAITVRLPESGPQPGTTTSAPPTARSEPAIAVKQEPGCNTEPLPAMSYPPLAGVPHPGSEAEQALEAALTTRPWAAGRTWNQTWQPHTLTNPVRVDLMWQQERCVIEIDGPDHYGALKYEADRQRDVLLQLAGFAVLRFTNAQIARDLAAVVSQIERFLTIRRTREGSDGD